jgi:L-ornithine Nalpha-acyltransferase
MKALCCRAATTLRQLDDALRIRFSVFGSELGLLPEPRPPAPREVNCFDSLESTVHLIVYAGETPVATTRLLLPNAEVARANHGRLGIDLEQKVDLSCVGGPGFVFAETTRFCILRDWRNSEVLVHLQAGLYRESLRRGVTHWLGSTNTETDSAEDALLAFQIAAHQGLVSPRWKAWPRPGTSRPGTPSAPYYTPTQRAQARQGQFEGLRIPRTLSLFARKMGARFISEPIYDAGFHRFSMPLAAALEDIPRSTLALLAAAR